MKRKFRQPEREARFLELKIEKIVPNGFGLGFAEGMTVFVSLAAAGDRVRVRITQQKGKTAFADIVEILERSPDRVDAPCVHFGKCGGCDFQQMNYEAQLRSKKGIVDDCLRRIGKLELPGEIKVVGSPQPFGYRSRAQWQADVNRRKIGYFRRVSHDVIDVEACAVLTEELQAELTKLRSEVSWGEFWSDKVVVEAASAGGEVSVYSSEIVEPTKEISYSLGENRYFYDARSFFQGNLLLVESLVGEAIDGLSGGTALDLYCGVGLFTLPLAKSFAKVVGIEANERSIESAKRNLENARIENVEVYAENVADWLRENGPSLGEIDLVLLDPPRAGTERETIELIVEMSPKMISYVSCEPSTLARDLRILVENGYKLLSVTALDLFPQTHHVETVVRLAKVG